MLSEAEKLKFFEGLCQELESSSFDSSSSDHAELIEDVVEVVRNYVNSTPNRDEIGVYKDDWLEKWRIVKINAFGNEKCPDISIQIGEQPFVAFEVKLLHPDWGLARGIGQSILYSALYAYTIIFTIDKRKFNAQKHEFDKAIESSLWDNYRVRLIIHQNEQS